MINNSLDINKFISLKTNESALNLDNNLLISLKELFGDLNKKKNNKNESGGVHILKNQKLQNKKETMTNKVNLILNKLSESHMNNLLSEFLENINQINNDEYIEIQKTFYLKMIAEPVFMDIYLKFFKLISFIYNKVLQYDISYFINLVQNKFYYDYKNIDCDDFLKNLNNENNRLANLQLIINMVNNNIVSKNIYNECDDIIINNKNNIIDTYHWFNLRNKSLTTDEKNKLTLLLDNIPKLSREYILLNSLLENKETTNNIVKPTKVTINKNHLNALECDNIIEEYILIKSLDDIKYFINNRCVDAINKNIFCENLINKYFNSKKETIKELNNLMKLLIDEQLLFKSNLSKGLALVYNNWKELVIDLNNPTDKMKQLLTFYKTLNISKNIEYIYNDFSIKLN